MVTQIADLHVVFKLADAEYALPAADVLEMESYTGVTPVPGVAPWIAGLTQIRGRVVPILDVRQRFGLPAAPPPPSARVIVAAVGDRTVGLLVDAAREVTRLDETAVGAAPDLLVSQAQGFVRGIARVKGRLIMLVDTGRLIGEEAAHGG